MRGGGVHERQQLAAGPAVAVLAGQRAAVAGDQPGGVLDEGPVPRPAPVRAGAEREVDPHVHAAVAEVPVRARPAARARRAARRTRAGSRRAAPAGRRRPPSRRAPGGRRGVRAASPAPSSRIRQIAAASAGVGDHQRVQRRRRRRARRRACVGDLGDVVAGQLDDQPAVAARQVGDDGGRDVAQPLHDPGVQALDGGGAVRQQRRAWRRRRRPSSGSRARPARGTGRRRPAGRWRPAPARACPRCRPAPGRRRSRARAAGAPASSRTPGGRTGRARCGSSPGRRRPGRRRSPRTPGAGGRAGAEPQPRRRRR